MTKKMAPNTGMINIEELGDPNAFRSEFNLDVVPKFNKHGDNINPIIRKIPIQSIDEYAFNPRQADNDHFEDIKNSIRKNTTTKVFSS